MSQEKQKQLEEHALLLAAGEVTLSDNTTVCCKVSKKGSSFGVVVSHPGTSRGLIFYSIDELRMVRDTIDRFLQSGK